MTRACSVEDVSAPPDLWLTRPTPPPLPHYAGHRDRLRERATVGGLAALPDYEVVEQFQIKSDRLADAGHRAQRLGRRAQHAAQGAEAGQQLLCQRLHVAARDRAKQQ